MLPSSPHVRNVYVEEDGIVPALRSLPPETARSTLCIDSTTLDVEVARTVASEVQKAGAAIVDAPVSGGVTGAKAATLSFLVGGPEHAFQRAHPHLLHMGKNVIYCGDSGAGLVAKICNNLILGVQQIVVAEAMLLGQKLGLDPKVLASVINSSTGACWASAVNNPAPSALPDKSPPCERDYEGGFATSLMLKVSVQCGCAPAALTRTRRVVGHGLGDGSGGIYGDPAADGACGGEDLRGRGERGPGAVEQGLFVGVPIPAGVCVPEASLGGSGTYSKSCTVHTRWLQCWKRGCGTVCTPCRRCRSGPLQRTWASVAERLNEGPRR